MKTGSKILIFDRVTEDCGVGPQKTWESSRRGVQAPVEKSDPFLSLFSIRGGPNGGVHPLQLSSQRSSFNFQMSICHISTPSCFFLLLTTSPGRLLTLCSQYRISPSSPVYYINTHTRSLIEPKHPPLFKERKNCHSSVADSAGPPSLPPFQSQTSSQLRHGFLSCFRKRNE
jgi:hypothetical protein